MSSGEPIEREIFIVHSKGEPRQDELFAALVPRLEAVGLRTWQYEDWAWDHRVQRRGRGEPRASGRVEQLDYQRYLAGHPMPFRAPVEEVDETTLAEMMHGSGVVLLLEPGETGPSEGVARERNVLGGLNKGPLLLHVVWSESDGTFFRPLRPAAELRLPPKGDSAVDEAFAFVATGWLVYKVQRRFGGTGGHRLMKLVAERAPNPAPLIEDSPRFEDEDAMVPKGQPEPGSFGEMLARMIPLHAEDFERWWADSAPLRSTAAQLGAGPTVTAFRNLVAAIDESWRGVFG
jgi:hypothetical protein